MRIPLEISYHQVDKVPELDTLIREQAARLGKFNRDLMHCQVAVEKEAATDYRVRIDVTVPPHQEVVVTRSADNHGGAATTLGPLVRDAFQIVQRKLSELNERRNAH